MDEEKACPPPPLLPKGEHVYSPNFTNGKLYLYPWIKELKSGRTSIIISAEILLYWHFLLSLFSVDNYVAIYLSLFTDLLHITMEIAILNTKYM